jgi:hypothetical protein
MADLIVGQSGTVKAGSELLDLAALSKIPIVTPTITEAAASVTDAECRGSLVLITGAATLTLPPVVVGASLTVFATTAAALSLKPNAADRIILDGVAGGDGKKITSASEAGNLVTLVGESTAGWTVVGRSGEWTMES